MKRYLLALTILLATAQPAAAWQWTFGSYGSGFMDPFWWMREALAVVTLFL